MISPALKTVLSSVHNAGFAGTEPTQLIIENDPPICVSTSYAITRHLLLASKSHVFVLPHLDPKSMWMIESLVFWALSDFGRALDGVNRSAINRAFNTLEKQLVKSPSKFLVGVSRRKRILDMDTVALEISLL